MSSRQSPEAPSERVRVWLTERPTPLLWICGPAGCGKTNAVEIALGRAAASAVVMRLSAFGAEGAAAESKTEEPRERLTTVRLLRRALEQHPLFLDGLDVLQQTTEADVNDIIDSRYRQLLSAACDQTLPGTAIIVTSRMAPPSALREDSLTVVELLHANVSRPSLPADGSQEWRVLEFVALSRRAIDPAAIRRMSGVEEAVILGALKSAAKTGLVTAVSDVSYQMPDWVRSSVLPDTTRTNIVRGAAIAALKTVGSDHERLLDLFLDSGDIDEAVMVYWRSLGNFNQLHHEGRDHTGAQLCRRLNGGLGPEIVSSALSASEGASAVMNDWSQFALCCGDAVSSALAAESAYRIERKDRPRWDLAVLAFHAGEAHLKTGNLHAAMDWCERSWNHAREGMRTTQGMPVREIMDAYDWSANIIAKIYLRLNQPLEIRRLIDDLTAIHEYARQSIGEFKAASVIPISGPSGKVTPEQLVDGRLAAMLALAEGRFGDIESVAAPNNVAGRELRTLLLRAVISAGRDEEAAALFASLQDSAEQQDDCDEECALAVMRELTLKDPPERLSLAQAYLPRAEACGLGLHWRDLQLVRARALEDVGRRDEGCGAAECALFGAGKMAGAYPSGDWVTVRGAVRLLQSAGREVPEQLLAGLEQNAAPKRHSPRKAEKRRAAPSDRRGVAARQDMHTAALGVVEAYEKDGTPFALYFRKFHIEVLHGPFELGPKLTENALRDALPPEVEVLTIQDNSSMTYDLGQSRLRREAPALSLENEHWAEVARLLIPIADLIVSEPLMLSEGVRTELQMIYDAHRWDRTVLLLPPQNSPLQMIDSDRLIQMFPRCLWADSLHEEPFTASPVVADLLERIRAIAHLPLDTRRSLRDLAARDRAYPVDLVPVAGYFEHQAQIGSVFDSEDATTRYYAFWQMFRASAIRGVTYSRGDTSAANCSKLAHSYIEMSKIMVDHSTEGERFILQGDPAEAKLLVQSACQLLQNLEGDLWVQYLRTQVEERWENLLRLQQALQDHPHRFEIRSRYGPLMLGK